MGSKNTMHNEPQIEVIEPIPEGPILENSAMIENT